MWPSSARAAPRGGRASNSSSDHRRPAAAATALARPKSKRAPRRRLCLPLLAPILLACGAAHLSQRALAQIDDRSSFTYDTPNATGPATTATVPIAQQPALAAAQQPRVTAVNVRLVSTGQPPVAWSLQKTADQSSVRVQAGGGQTATVNYLVRVTASGPISHDRLPFQVTGSIVVYNPNSALYVRLRQVSANLQMVAGPALASWASGPTGGPMKFPAECDAYTVPPNGDIICTFSAPVASAGAGQVTPVVYFLEDDGAAQAAAGPGKVKGVPVPILVPRGLSAPPCATVSDAFSGGRQPTQVTGNRPTSDNTCDTKTYSYQAVFGPYKTTECGTFTVTNTATVTPSGGSQGQAQTQSASVNVEVFGCDAATATVAPASAPASAPAPPPPPGIARGTATTSFGDQQPQAFAQPYAALTQVVGQYSGAAAEQPAGDGSGGWTVTITQNPPGELSLRANGADTAAVSFTVTAFPQGAAAPPVATASSTPVQAFVSGTVNLVNPVAQAFAVQDVAVEVSNSVVIVGSGMATCPELVLPAATAQGPGMLACLFAAPVATGTPGVVTARVLMPQLAQAVLSPPVLFAFASGPARAAGAGGGADGSSSMARVAVDSTFAPAGFAYAPLTISGSGTRPATATEGGTFLTGPQTWTWALTLGPFPKGTFCGANRMTTAARAFPLLPSGQVDSSQQVAQSSASLNVLVDCGGAAGPTATETYVASGERRRRKMLF